MITFIFVNYSRLIIILINFQMENLKEIITSKYPFVETKLCRNSKEFYKNRLAEEEIIGKIRNATLFCKKETELLGTELANMNADDKLKMEQCLNDNFLSKDVNYFGKRDTIFIDMH